MRDDVAWIKLDFDLVLGFADFDAPADPGDRNRVTAGVQGDVAFDIGDALMQSVDLRNPDRERFEMRAFDGEQFAGNRTDVFFVGAVDAIAPLAGLLIQILPTGERAAGPEVSLNKMEGTFEPGRTVGIATFVRGEAKTERVPKALQSRKRNHV